MKKPASFLFLTLIFIGFAQNQNEKKSIRIASDAVKNTLSLTESSIVNEFLEAELKKERYKEYKGFETEVISESLSKRQSIKAYLYSLNEWQSIKKINKEAEAVKKRFFLDEVQVKKLQTVIENEEVYHWKISDFKNTKVNLLPYDELRKTINNNSYSLSSKKLIIYISKPLIIDQDNAFISFEIGNGQLGFSSITHFTVLMKKVNNHWVDYDHYEDGVYN